MDNKHRKLFVIGQSKKRKFMPKMPQNTFGGRAQPVPAGGGLKRSPIPLAASGAYFKGREGKGEKRNGREGGKEERKRKKKQGEGNDESHLILF